MIEMTALEPDTGSPTASTESLLQIAAQIAPTPKELAAFLMIYQAAIDELGIVVAQRAFVEDELRTGRLVAVFDLQVATENGYYLAYPTTDRPIAKIRAFESWIMSEAAAMKE